MPTPDRDVVEEARELDGWAVLAMPPSPHWPERATADGSKRVDRLIAALADEVERLRGYVETVEMNRIADWQAGEAYD